VGAGEAGRRQREVKGGAACGRKAESTDRFAFGASLRAVDVMRAPPLYPSSSAGLRGQQRWGGVKAVGSSRGDGRGGMDAENARQALALRVLPALPWHRPHAGSHCVAAWAHMCAGLPAAFMPRNGGSSMQGAPA
jgi:hypothetical protein